MAKHKKGEPKHIRFPGNVEDGLDRWRETQRVKPGESNVIIQAVKEFLIREGIELEGESDPDDEE